MTQQHGHQNVFRQDRALRMRIAQAKAEAVDRDNHFVPVVWPVFVIVPHALVDWYDVTSRLFLIGQFPAIIK